MAPLLPEPPPGLRTGARRVLYAALAVLLATFVALVAVEAGLRAYCRWIPNADVEFFRYANLMKAGAPGSGVRFLHEPGSRLRLFGVDVEINSRGFRDIELPPEKPPGTTRIALLGDSITFGWGVRYGERFSEILARRWSESGPGTFELINTGHGNYNTAQEYAILRELLADEPLDGILQVWYINDAEPTPSHREAPWYAHFRTAIFLWAKSDLLMRRLGERVAYTDYYRGLYGEGAPGFDEFRRSLARTGDWARERGIPWVFVVLPEFHDFRAEGPFRDVFARVKELAAAAGAKVLDATWIFEGRDPAPLWVARNDVHPNAAGHALIAEAILHDLDPAIFRGGPSPEVTP